MEAGKLIARQVLMPRRGPYKSETDVLTEKVNKIMDHLGLERAEDYEDGELAYDAYKEAVGGKTWNGDDMKSWSELPINIRKGWFEAYEKSREN